MPANIPDPLSVEVQRGVEDSSFQVRLTMPDGSWQPGILDLTSLRAALHDIELQRPVWYSEDPAEYGRLLYEHLFSGQLSFHYGGALSASGERGVQLRLDLDPETPELHAVPWERIYQPSALGQIPLAAAPNTFFSRYLSTGAAWGLPLGAGALRTLIVVSSPYPQGHEMYVDRDAELAAITGVLDEFPQNVTYEFLDGPVTLKRITDRLADGFDILHYTGHGFWDSDEQMSYLILEDPVDGGVQPSGVSRKELLDRLRLLDKLPRLIVLAACESAQQATRDGLLGLGPALVDAGCPAVIAMQEPVEVEIARRFGQAFYSELLQHGFVDQAVNRARRVLFDASSWQWAVPVLFMRLLDGLLFLPEVRFKPAQRSPYKFLTSYTSADADLFKGREELATRVFRRIQEYAVTVVYGESGVGLTSLLQAGVRPRLEDADDLVIVVSEYENLASEVRVQARISGRPLQLPIRGDAPLPEVLTTLGARSSGRLILVLDQFERVFELDPEHQQSLADDIAASLAGLGEQLRLAVVIHTDYLRDFAAMQERFEAIAQPWIETPVLSRDSATEAVVDPLQELDWPVNLKRDFARDQIVRELDQLHEPEEHQKEGSINPGQLQIVCYWLYEAARDRDPPEIDRELYVQEAGGAEGILTRYMQQTLATQLADEQALARQILVAMADSEAELRITPANLDIEGIPTERIRSVLERLTDAELLVRRRRDGKAAYAFANVIVAQEARNLGGEELRRRYQAGDELERIWRMWIAAVAEEDSQTSPADQALPNRGQLRYLAESGEHLRPRPVKALLMLRAAVIHYQLDMQPWLLWLQTSRGADLVQRLETNQQGDPAQPCTYVELDRSSRLLGLYELADEDREGGDTSQIGTVARAALHHPDPATRQTATLVLTALQPLPDEALSRLSAGMEAIPERGLRRQRTAEVWAILLDADIKLPEGKPELTRTENWGVWWHRVRRRIIHDWRQIAALTLGGAVGAGLGLAILRTLISLPTTLPPGAVFGIFFFYGFLLGAAVSAGLLLADYFLLLRPRPDNGASSRSRWYRPLVTIVMGAAAFGIMHLVVALLNGLRLMQSGLIVPLAFVAGVGLSVSLYRQPEVGLRLHPGNWLLRLAASALSFALVQWVLNAVADQWGNALAIGWSGAFYNSEFNGYTRFTEVIDALTPGFIAWPNALSLIDAMLVGVVLTTGITLGLVLAARKQRS
ncbi:MAG: CHAT domain-containing protein [Chloroflexota bacterium]|nr:CHAT domain-containing protein [Chloroflexota bacterium]